MPTSAMQMAVGSTGLKDKLFKRHAARIRRPSAGFCGVWRRHIMRFMFTRGESCPGLPQLFRRRTGPAILTVFAVPGSETGSGETRQQRPDLHLGEATNADI